MGVHHAPENAAGTHWAVEKSNSLYATGITADTAGNVYVSTSDGTVKEIVTGGGVLGVGVSGVSWTAQFTVDNAAASGNGPILIKDTSDNITAYLEGLQSIGDRIESVTLIDPSSPIKVKSVQLQADASILSKISNVFSLSVTSGTGGEKMTFPIHAASVDTLIEKVGTSGVNTANPGDTLINVDGMDIVVGLHAGDRVDLSGLGSTTNSSVVNASNLAASANTVSLVSGVYNAGTGSFAYSGAGSDTLLTYQDTTGAGFESVVLVGIHAIAGQTSMLNGVVTLG